MPTITLIMYIIGTIVDKKKARIALTIVNSMYNQTAYTLGGNIVLANHVRILQAGTIPTIIIPKALNSTFKNISI